MQVYEVRISHGARVDMAELRKFLKAMMTVEGAIRFPKNDTHIIDAINEAGRHGRQGSPNDKLMSVYVGAFSEADYQHMQSIRNKFHFKMECFDARTAHIWE